MDKTSHLTIVTHDGKTWADPIRGYSFVRNGSDGVTNESKSFKTRALLLEAWVEDRLGWKFKEARE